ncbi:MAG: hypothetical protein ACKV22_28615 [Bryobacteraceae bacterium]
MLKAELRRAVIQLAPDFKAGARNAAALALAGAGLPWLVGLSLLDPLVLIPLACLSVFPTARFAAPPFAGAEARERIAGQPLPRVVLAVSVAAVLIGCLVSWAVLSIALLWLTYWNWHGAWLLPSWITLAAAALASVAASAVAAFWSILVATDAPDAASARRAIRGRLIAITVVFMLGPQYVPAGWTTWLAADLTTEGVARKTVIVSLLLLAAAWVLARAAVRRAAQWSATPPSLNTYSGRETGL